MTGAELIAALLADRDRLAGRIDELEAESRLAAKTPTESEFRKIVAENEVPPECVGVQEEKWGDKDAEIAALIARWEAECPHDQPSLSDFKDGRMVTFHQCIDELRALSQSRAGGG